MILYSSISEFLDSKKNSGDSAESAGIFYRNSHLEDSLLLSLQYQFTQDKKNKLIVFYPGAFDRTRSTLPKFQRSTYFKWLKYNALSFFDATHYLTDDPAFKSGWFQGTAKIFYADAYAELIAQIAKSRNIENKNILLYATSAGGLPCLKAAAKLPGCNVVITNIQTDLLRLRPGRLETIMRTSYPGLSEVEVMGTHAERLTVLNEQLDVNLIYAQNTADPFHHKNHFLPYVDKLKQGLNKGRSSIIVYTHDETGHQPLPREYELRLIESVLDEKERLEDIYSPFLEEILSL